MNTSPLPTDKLTGVILAGGKGRRFGSDKAFALYRGERLIDRTVRVMGEIFRDVGIVTNFPGKYGSVPATIWADEIPFQGPAGGIVTALRAVNTEAIFVVACDLPLLSGKVILNLMEKENGASLVLYQHARGLEPLCALYRKELLPRLEQRLQSGRGDLYSLADERGVTVQKIPLDRWGRESLRNLNRVGDLKSLLKRKQP
ncbi:MAG: molybdenum cofactor guanylyltransferase [Deltaproteobacteria bacterium]|nr:molybdenum cofactor guanylyltransferase [Deltaproteobacteria bacterium]